MPAGGLDGDEAVYDAAGGGAAAVAEHEDVAGDGFAVERRHCYAVLATPDEGPHTAPRCHRHSKPFPLQSILTSPLFYPLTHLSSHFSPIISNYLPFSLFTTDFHST